MVCVINKEGKPLMPTKRNGVVGLLLRHKKAVVIGYRPFTIQLTYDTTDYVQDVKVGIDCGSKHVGVSVTTNKEELYSAVYELRSDITDLISTRRELRRTRRGKLRYRKARFNNRVAVKKKGWLPPSIMYKVQCHENIITKLAKMFPVNGITIEIGEFDVQRILNPEINSTDYQNGQQKDYYNTRQYVLCRDNHTCQHCHGKSGCKILNVHHIESRKVGGDSPNNLITLCEECHARYHRGEIKLKFNRGKSYKDAAAMNTMKDRLYKNLIDTYGEEVVSKTYGYITKMLRHEYGIEKTHNSDAMVISGNPQAKPCEEYYAIKRVRRHNRQIHKTNPKKGGKRPLNQAPYLVNGFRLNDVVMYEGVECVITGRRSSGYFVIKDSEYKKVSDGISYKKLKFKHDSRGEVVFLKRISSHD